MKLYASRIPTISRELVDSLIVEGDIEVLPEQVEEVALDIEAVLREYLRQERDITERARDAIASRNLPYNQLHKLKQELAKKRGFGLGEDSVDYLTKQLIEVLFHTHRVEEVFSEDHELRKKMRPVLRRQMSTETDLDHEVRGRIKNLQEGTSTWDIEYQRVMEELKQSRKLS